MSQRHEFNAETVEAAINRASAALGISEDRLDVEVVDQGSAGFLGMGARDARITVEVPELDTDAQVVEEEVGVAAEEETPVPPVEEHDEPAEPARVAAEEPATPVDAPDDLIIAVDEFLTSLLDKMGFDATVDAYDAGEVISVNVATKETGLFIGQKGETIDAIQHLLNVTVYRDRPFVKRIQLDSEGYRQRRVEALRGMAHRTARRALREQRPLSLPLCPPANAA